MSFQLTPPPIQFFWWPTLKKNFIFFSFKVSTYSFGMGIIFLLTLLQILTWGEKVLTLCQKMHFFWQTTRFPLEIAKKTFLIEISENNVHILPFHVTWSVKTIQKTFLTEDISFIFYPKQNIFGALECFWSSFPIWDETFEFATVFLWYTGFERNDQKKTIGPPINPIVYR